MSNINKKVAIKHVINDQLNRHFLFFTGSITTVASASGVGSTSVVVAFPTVINSGDTVFISNGNVEEPSKMHVTAVGSPFVTLDAPLSKAYPIGTQVEVVDSDLSSTTASLGGSRSYKVKPSSGTTYHIARLNVAIADANAMDDGKFGGIASLANGVVIRKSVKGVITTLTNWKNNGDMAKDMFDVAYTDKAPSGENGLRGRWSFNKFEVYHVIKGEDGDYLEALVQDNITANTLMELKVQGHPD